jgi:hypothetical protein
MVEPPPHHEFGVPGELTDALPRGSSLWDLAQQGSQRSPHSAAASGADALAGRRRFTLWMVGVVGVLGVVTTVSLVATVKAPVSRAAGGGGASQSSSDSAAGAAGATVPATTSVSSCSAQAVDPDPSIGKTDEIVVSHVPVGTVVSVDLAFPGGSAQYSATSGSGGVADVRVAVVGDRPSRPVAVSVTAGDRSCTASFTPSEPVSG